MPTVNTQVTADTLQAFADAWNRHDVDALMSFTTEDCAFEASAGPKSGGSDTSALNPFAPVSPRFGQRSPTHIGVTHVILWQVIAECRSGHSRAPAPMALTSKSKAVTFLPFETARSR
jgi:hypothetical protein